jgi:hypothetical protein
MPAGVFEIEYGLEAAEGRQNINGPLKFGLTKNLELRFGNNPIERDAGVAGRGDSVAQYKIFEEKSWRPTFSVLYAAMIATAQVGAGAEFCSARTLENIPSISMKQRSGWAAGSERIRPGSFCSVGVLTRGDGRVGCDRRDGRIQPHQGDDARPR